MCDDWEDWENEDFVVPTFVPNEEQLKRLEERKLVEESDAKIARELFEFNDFENLADNKIKKFSQQNTNTNDIKPKRQKIVSNQKANEEKQQESARIKREQKAKKIRENELYGEVEEDEYADYEDKFY